MTHKTDNVANESHKHVCLNCGTEYEGRFCPECGQRASVGRLTMLSVLRSFLAVAGFSNGKLWKTLLHSVTRPGHMIREYLQGKRTYYIKPLNLLVVLSLLFVILQNVLPINLFSDGNSVEMTEDTRAILAQADSLEHSGEGTKISINGMELSEKIKPIVDTMEDWFRGNMGYYRLLCQLLLIPGTMLCFRKSKTYPKSNLPENFFIQVFVSNQLMLLDLLWLLCSWGRYRLPTLIFLLVLIYDYKQLFGFSWGRTTWKVALVYLWALIIMILLISVGIAVGYYFRSTLGITAS